MDIDKKIESIRKQAKEMEEGLKHISEMQEEMKTIIKMHNDFNSKYSNFAIKEVFNCHFELKNWSDYRYR